MGQEEKILKDNTLEEKLEKNLFASLSSEANFLKDSTEEKQLNIPLYAIKGNSEQRRKILRKLPFSKDMVNIFEYLCEFAISEANSPYIVVEEFKKYYQNIPDGITIDKKKLEIALYDVIELLSSEDIQVIKKVAYNDENKAEEILLLEKKEGNLQHEKKIKKFILTNFKGIKETTGKFFQLEEMSEILNINFSILQNYGITIPIKKISLELIESHHLHKENKIFFIVDMKRKEIGKIVLPILSSIEISFFLINLIKDFYKNNRNRELKIFLLNKLQQKNIEASKIHRLLNSMRIQDPYFIFFTQVFQSIVKNIYEKKKGVNNKISSELFNQLVSASILSQISFNHREHIRKQEELESEKQERFKMIFEKIIKYHKFYGKEKVFYPVTYHFIENINFNEDSSSAGEDLIYKNIYKKKDFLDYIKKRNDSKEIFKEFLIFQSEGKIFYLHRVRIISAFLTLTLLEKQQVIERLKKRFKLNKEELFSYATVENIDKLVSRYISAIYLTLLNLILKLFQDSKILMNRLSKEDLSYLINRLFFNELEILHYKKNLPDLCYEDFEEKKKLMLFFIKTIFNEYGKVKEFPDMLNIDFYEIKQEVLSETEINFFLIVFYNFKDFMLNLSSFFSLDVGKDFLKKTFNKLKNFFITITKKVDSSFSTPQREVEPKKNSAKKINQGDKIKKDSILIKNIPELSEINNIKKKMAHLVPKWNEAEDTVKNQENLEKINSLAKKMFNRFDVNEITKKNMDFIFSIIKQNNSYLNDFKNQVALKEYLFYNIALLKYENSN